MNRRNLFAMCGVAVVRWLLPGRERRRKVVVRGVDESPNIRLAMKPRLPWNESGCAGFYGEFPRRCNGSVRPDFLPEALMGRSGQVNSLPYLGHAAGTLQIYDITIVECGPEPQQLCGMLCMSKDGRIGGFDFTRKTGYAVFVFVTMHPGRSIPVHPGRPRVDLNVLLRKVPPLCPLTPA